MGGLKCRACRRYVLGWPHVLVLVVLSLALVVFMLDFIFRV